MKRNEEGNIDSIIALLEKVSSEVSELQNDDIERIYTSKEVEELLHVDKRLLRKYRQKHLLPYSQFDDKYWYRASDIETFFKNIKN